MKDIDKYTHKEIEQKLEIGTVVAVMDRKIASKKVGDKYFSCRWQDNKEDAKKVWEEIIDKIIAIGFEYDIKIIEIGDIVRRELTIKGCK